MPENGTTAKRWFFALPARQWLIALWAISFVLLLAALGAFALGSWKIKELTTDGSQTLSSKHFKDLPALISKLRNPPDAILRDIHDQFSANAQSILTNTAFTPAHLESLVITELNSVLTNRCIYDSNRFVNVMLPSEVHKWIQENPKGEQLLRLNLSLLRRAYPEIVVSSIEMRTGMWGLVTKWLGEIQAITLGFVSITLIIISGFVTKFKRATKRENDKVSQNSASTSLWEVLPFASLVFFTVAVFMLCDLASSPETADAEGGGSVRLLCKLGLYLMSALVTAIVVLYGAHLVKFERSVTDLTDEIRKVGADAKNTQEQIAASEKSIDLMTRINKIGVRDLRIRKGLQILADNHKPALDPLSKTLGSMLTKMKDLQDVSLLPLLLPGTSPPQPAHDTIAEIGETLEKATLDDACLPHFAYMSAALGRDFEAQSSERYFPGVLLNVAGFAYYVKTIQEIAESLEPWPKQFEFYTLMPESPVQVFQFANSTQFSEWQDFLHAYQKSQEQNSRVWKRYFCFRRTAESGEAASKPSSHSFHEQKVIKPILKGAVVLTGAANSWLPKEVKRNEVSNYVPAEPADKVPFKEINEFPENTDSGSLVYSRTLSGAFWRPLREILLEYHGLPPKADEAAITAKSNLIFRLMDDDLIALMQKPVAIQSRPDAGKTDRRTEKLRIPYDLFAIKDVSQSKWIFVIGRASNMFGQNRIETDRPPYPGFTTQGSESHSMFAFSPVIDLNTLERDNGVNGKAATQIRKILDLLFAPPGNTGAYTLTQFEKLTE